MPPSAMAVPPLIGGAARGADRAGAVRPRRRNGVPLSPKRALELAQELLTRGVQAIKADWPG